MDIGIDPSGGSMATRKKATSAKTSAARKSGKRATATSPAVKRSASRRVAAKRTGKTSGANARAGHRSAAAPKSAPVGDFTQLARGAKLLSAEQAIELYKANSRMALDVINAAIESTTRLHKLQWDGAERARAFGERQVRTATTAQSPDTLMAAGQGAAREAIEQAMGYWSQMFDLIVEIQKRLFTLIEGQMGDVPGVKEARAAMAMMPDMSQTQNVIRALQGVVTSSGGAVEQMQKVMGDLARMGTLRR
jgi:hypothetical protein